MPQQLDSFGARRALRVGERSYTIVALDALERAGFGDVARLPFSLKLLLENLLRCEDGRSVTKEHIAGLARWPASAQATHSPKTRGSNSNATASATPS